MYAILKQWLLKQMSLFPQHLKASVCSCGFGFCHFCLDYIWNSHWAIRWTWQRLARTCDWALPFTTGSSRHVPYPHRGHMHMHKPKILFPESTQLVSMSHLRESPLSSQTLCNLIESVVLWCFYDEILLPDTPLKLSFVGSLGSSVG